MVAIVHDDEIRHLIADRIVDVTSFAVSGMEERASMTSTTVPKPSSATPGSFWQTA